MGMDCMGDNPSCELGEYFRANIWSWCPIHHLICHFCDQHAEVFDTTLIDDETLSTHERQRRRGAFRRKDLPDLGRLLRDLYRERDGRGRD